MPISKRALPSASATSALLSVASFLPLLTSLRIASVSIHARVLGLPAALPLASGALAFGAPTLPLSFASGFAPLPLALGSGLAAVLGAALLGAFAAAGLLLELGFVTAALLEVTGLALLLAARLIGFATAFAGATGRALVLLVLLGLGLLVNGDSLAGGFLLDFAVASSAFDLLEVAGLFEEADLLAELEGAFGAACLGVVTLTGLLAMFLPFPLRAQPDYGFDQTVVSTQQRRLGAYHPEPNRKFGASSPVTGRTR